MTGDESSIDAASAYAHVHPDDLAKIRAAVHRAITQKKPFTVEFRIRHPDGIKRVALGQGEVITWTPTGQPRRMVGTMVDITRGSARGRKGAARGHAQQHRRRRHCHRPPRPHRQHQRRG